MPTASSSSSPSRIGAAVHHPGAGVDPLEAQIRQVFFFDTPDLALNNAGVVARARRVQGKGDDSVVKLRPVVPGELPSELRASTDFNVEVDAMPGGFVCSGSYKCARTAVAGHGGRQRRGAVAQAVHEGAAGVLRRARTGRGLARRPPRARPDLRAQAALLPCRLHAGTLRGGAVAVPGRQPHLRAVDEVRAGDPLATVLDSARTCSARASTSAATSTPRPSPRWSSSWESWPSRRESR